MMQTSVLLILFSFLLTWVLLVVYVARLSLRVVALRAASRVYASCPDQAPAVIPMAGRMFTYIVRGKR